MTSVPALLMKHRPRAAHTIPGVGHATLTVEHRRRDTNAFTAKATTGRGGARNHVPETR